MVAVSVVTLSFLLALPALAEPILSPHLAARQLDGFNPFTIPAACQATCKPLVDTVTNNNCTNVDCVCTNTIATGLKTCLQCGIDAKFEGLNQTSADATVKDFVDGCNAAGKAVTISSGSTNSSGGSSASSSASSSTISSAGSSASKSASRSASSSAVSSASRSATGSASAASGTPTATAGKSGAIAMGFSVAGVVVAGALGIFSLA